MKKILILLCLPLIGFGQDLPFNRTGRVSYEGIVRVEGVSKKDLYKAANEWFTKAYIDNNLNDKIDVIKMLDKEECKIIAKPRLTVIKWKSHVGDFLYTITFQSKEGRYRYTIDNIYHYCSFCPSGGPIENEDPICGKAQMFKKHWKFLKSYAHEDLLRIEASLKRYLSQAGKYDDNW